VKTKKIINRIILVLNIISVFLYTNLQFGFFRELTKSESIIIMTIGGYSLFSPIIVIIYFFLFKSLNKASKSDKIIFIVNFLILLYMAISQIYYIITTPIM